MRHGEVVMKIVAAFPHDIGVPVELHEANPLVQRDQVPIRERVHAPPVLVARDAHVGGRLVSRPQGPEVHQPAMPHHAAHVRQHCLGGVTGTIEIQSRLRVLGIKNSDAAAGRLGLGRAGVPDRREHLAVGLGHAGLTARRERIPFTGRPLARIRWRGADARSKYPFGERPEPAVTVRDEPEQERGHEPSREGVYEDEAPHCFPRNHSPRKI